jgi:hypothetical protein
MRTSPDLVFVLVDFVVAEVGWRCFGRMREGGYKPLGLCLPERVFAAEEGEESVGR